MITFSHITKQFSDKQIFSNLDFTIKQKEIVCIRGESGVGKSTLFNLLIKRDEYQEGEIYIDSVPLSSIQGEHLQFYRRKIGMVFQDFKLLPHKTVYENLSFILEICDEKEEKIFPRIKKVLQIVGLEEKIGHFIHELSGGEAQRIAIARAIVHNPKIILADEPTGNLDPENTTMILDILKYINTHLGVTIILSTHNPLVPTYLQSRVITLKNGKIESDTLN